MDEQKQLYNVKCKYFAPMRADILGITNSVRVENMTKKPSFRKLERKGHYEKVRIIKLLLRRRFDLNSAIDYLMERIEDETQVDDMLRELLIWDELSRR